MKKYRVKQKNNETVIEEVEERVSTYNVESVQQQINILDKDIEQKKQELADVKEKRKKLKKVLAKARNNV